MIVASRFRGFPEYAQGGYVGGLLAGALDARGAEVRFLRPTPVDRELDLGATPDGRVELRTGQVVHAFGVPADVDLEVPALPSTHQARSAARRYAGHEHHLLPHCFACGPERGDGDGLRIFPGPLYGGAIVAGVWTPHAHDADGHGQIRPEVVWAALDCPQLWALIQDAPLDSDERVVTGSLATRIDRPVIAGEPHVVMGWPIARDGRMIFAGGAVLAADGAVCAVGRQTAIVASWGVPLGLGNWLGEHDAPAVAEAA